MLNDPYIVNDHAIVSHYVVSLRGELMIIYQLSH